MENLTTQLSELIVAVQRSDVAQVKRLIAANVSPNQISSDGKSALMVASQIGHPEILRLLCTAATLSSEPAHIFFDTGVASPETPNHQAFNSSLGKLTHSCLATDAMPKEYVTIWHQRQEDALVTDYAALVESAIGDHAIENCAAQPTTPTPERQLTNDHKRKDPSDNVLGQGIAANFATEQSAEQSSSLKFAVQQNELSKVQALLRAGVSLRPKTWHETPVLVTAAGLGHVEIVRALITAGANVNNGYDRLPLHIAAENGHLSVVQLLLQSGAYIHGTEENGRTALMAAASGGYLPVVQYLVEQGANLQATSKGETALTVAAKKEQPQIYRYLHSLMHSQHLGTDSFAVPTKTFETVSSSPQAVTPSAATMGTEQESRFIHSMSDRIQPSSMVHPLIEDLLTAAADGQLTRLQAAIAELSNPRRDINRLGITGRSALSTAIQAEHIAIVEALLDAGADPNQPDTHTRSLKIANYPLMVAAQVQSSIHRCDFLKLLIRQGARINQVDRDGRTALMHAIDCNHLDAIKTLIAAGSDLEIRNHAGETPLTQAQMLGNRAAATLVKQAMAQQVQAGSLIQAITQNQINTVRQMLQAGADPNSHTDSLTALSQAAANGFVSIAKLLIAAGADLNYVAEATALPPLIYAAYRGQLAMVETLLVAGADVFIQASGNLNALEYAQLGKQQRRNAGKPFDAIIDQLKSYGLTASAGAQLNN